MVSPDFFWARGATGTIRKPPAELLLLSGAWNSLTRVQESALGKHTVYWVEFDEPQRDADGDGPYRAGCIHEDSLLPLSRISN